MTTFFSGLAFGLVFIFSVGPAFFLLIQTSIEGGFKKAAFLALGISLSDILYVVMIMKGVTSFLENPNIRFWAGIFGVGVLIAFGAFTFFKKPIISSYSNNLSPKGYFKNFTTGFVFNFFNPSTAIFWLGIVSITQINFNYSESEKLPFFVGILLTIISTDLTKSFLAGRLKNIISLKILSVLNKVVGLILFGFGLTLLTQLF